MNVVSVRFGSHRLLDFRPCRKVGAQHLPEQAAANSAFSAKKIVTGSCYSICLFVAMAKRSAHCVAAAPGTAKLLVAQLDGAKTAEPTHDGKNHQPQAIARSTRILNTRLLIYSNKLLLASVSKNSTCCTQLVGNTRFRGRARLLVSCF